MKIAILSSYTVDFFVSEVEKLLKESNIKPEIYVSPFNQYKQEILDENSELKKFKPDIILLALHAEEFINGTEQILYLLMLLSQNFSSSTILVHNCVIMQENAVKFLEWNVFESQNYKVSKINSLLAGEVLEFPNIFILDLDNLVRKYGYEKMFDPRFYYLAKMQFSKFGNSNVAQQLADAILTLKGKRKKCLLLDLDNTLWGGIIGEDGFEHIKLSNDGEGKAFYDFQQQIQKLYNTGILLAICSKNDYDMAMEVVEKHPYMVLRKDHFSAIRINWLDKPQNILSIAEELNIGTDSFVFLDDSEFERQLVKSSLPEVEVPGMPKDFSYYPSFLANLTFFDTFSVTKEDTERSQLYVQERKRAELKSVASLEDFLKSLELKVKVDAADNFTIPRISQLTQRTNQFNLTTRRYSENEIRSLSENDRWKVFSISASDKIGETGIVGVAILKCENKNILIDTLLMSCRVLGRGIETAFMVYILKYAKDCGYEKVIGEYIPTKKNSMAKDFLVNNGFEKIKDHYGFNLSKEIIFPDWIEFYND